MEAEQIVKGILDGVYLRIGLTPSFVYFSGCDVNPTDEISWWFVINYLDLYSFVANGIVIITQSSDLLWEYIQWNYYDNSWY